MTVLRRPRVVASWRTIAFAMLAIEVINWRSWAGVVPAGVPEKAEAYVVGVGEGWSGRVVR